MNNTLVRLKKIPTLSAAYFLARNHTINYVSMLRFACFCKFAIVKHIMAMPCLHVCICLSDSFNFRIIQIKAIEFSGYSLQHRFTFYANNQIESSNSKRFAIILMHPKICTRQIMGLILTLVQKNLKNACMSNGIS